LVWEIEKKCIHTVNDDRWKEIISSQLDQVNMNVVVVLIIIIMILSCLSFYLSSMTSGRGRLPGLGLLKQIIMKGTNERLREKEQPMRAML
jgi:hypothetical protein